MICPYCNNPAKYCENKEIYGRNYGRSYMCYFCKPCNAYVMCHNNTTKAMGTLANAELREYRKQAHNLLDPLWKTKKFKRRELYTILSKHFNKDTHIGESNIEECKALIKFIKTLIN